jgi:hypothetical protein
MCYRQLRVATYMISFMLILISPDYRFPVIEMNVHSDAAEYIPSGWTRSLAREG